MVGKTNFYLFIYFYFLELSNHTIILWWSWCFKKTSKAKDAILGSKTCLTCCRGCKSLNKFWVELWNPAAALVLNRNQTGFSSVGRCLRPWQSCRSRGQGGRSETRRGSAGCCWLCSWTVLLLSTAATAGYQKSEIALLDQPVGINSNQVIIHQQAPVKPSESTQRRTQHCITSFISSCRGFPFSAFFFFFPNLDLEENIRRHHYVHI